MRSESDISTATRTASRDAYSPASPPALKPAVAGPVHSAGLAVVEDVAWAVTDLRVDWNENPLEELRALWARWRPDKQDYRTRGLDPRDAPSYGVPGDL